MAEGYDYHFLVLAPGLQSAWFFQAARRYWQAFQPIVTDDLRLLDYPPTGSTIAVTVLARPDTADYMQGKVEEERAGTRLDMVVADDLATMEATLDRRAELNTPLG